MKQLIVRLDKELYNELKIYARSKGLTMAGLVRNMIIEKLRGE